jgi:Polyprenyl synthetase
MFTHFSDYAASVKPALDSAYAGELARALGNRGPEVKEVGLCSLTAGKKLRGTLLCLVAAALGGTLAEALPRAVAIELIQAATLLHDDFVDQHRTRRRLPALWTLQGARRAVLLGDVIFSSAIYMMGEQGHEDGLIVARAIAEISRGAYQEPLDAAALLAVLENGMEASVYEKIIDLKTAVLFGAACQLGAVSAGAGNEKQTAWRRYGLMIGQAYQLADDLQDVQRILARGKVTPAEMTSLVPAFRFFLPTSSPFLRQVLQEPETPLSGEVDVYFLALAGRLAAERQRRVSHALDALAGEVGESAFSDLVRRAPKDIIGVFETAEALSPVACPP